MAVMRRSSSRRLLRRVALALVGCASYLCIHACNSVYIPIPPPDPTFTQTTSAGEWEVHTGPDSRAVGARFYIYNATLGSGIIQKAEGDGSMSAFPLHGQPGDHVEIHWERSITETSSTICRPLGAGLVQTECR
jgi:hypothetical protein